MSLKNIVISIISAHATFSCTQWAVNNLKAVVGVKACKISVNVLGRLRWCPEEDLNLHSPKRTST